MAKKAKQKLDEEEKAKAFKFPEFDVPAFLNYELEQTWAMLIALMFSIAMIIVAWRVTLYGLSIGQGGVYGGISLVLGIFVAVVMIDTIRRIRPKASEYRKGDWAMLIMLYLFLFLGIWALLLNP